MNTVCVQSEATKSDFIAQICKKPVFVIINGLNFKTVS